MVAEGSLEVDEVHQRNFEKQQAESHGDDVRRARPQARAEESESSEDEPES